MVKKRTHSKCHQTFMDPLWVLTSLNFTVISLTGAPLISGASNILP